MAGDRGDTIQHPQGEPQHTLRCLTARRPTAADDSSSQRFIEPTAKPTMRRVHFIWGLIGVVAFLATGQYMDRWHDHLRDTEPVQRLLFRSTHIYLLWSALVNVLLGLHLTAVAGWRRVVQSVGSVLLLLAPALFLAAFATEPWLSGLDRPYTRPAVYGSLAGVVLHLVSAWPGTRRSI